MTQLCPGPTLPLPGLAGPHHGSQLWRRTGASGEAGVGVAEGAGVRPRGSPSCPLLCGAGQGFDLSRLCHQPTRGTLLPFPELTSQTSGREVQEHVRLPGQERTRGAGRGEEGTGPCPVAHGHDRRCSLSRAPCWGQNGF